jgi:hypothetical protein
MKTKTRQTEQPSEPSVAVALAQLEATIKTLRADDTKLLALQLKYEKENPNIIAKPMREDEARVAAYEKLNGSAPPLVADKRTPYAKVVAEREAIKVALEISSPLWANLHGKVREQKAAELYPEFKALMLQKAQTVIALEQIDQAIDAMVKDTSLENYRMQSGRLSNTGSSTYNFLREMVARDIFKQKDFEAEFERAWKASRD